MDSISQQATLTRNVVIIDTANHVVVRGEYGKSDQTSNYSYVTKKALMILISNGQDSTFVHSDTLFVSQDSLENSVIRAYYKTRFFSQDLQGLCDSMVYLTADSTITLYGNPVVWAAGNQLTGDVISLLTGDNTVKEFYLKANAMMIAQKWDTEMFDQIKGRNITGYFRENELYRIFVDGNGEMCYFPEDNGKIIGVNTTTSPTITILISQRKVTDIKFYGKTDGQLNPLLIVPPTEARLKGFRWLDYLRPVDKDDIFNYRTFKEENESKSEEDKREHETEENQL